MRTIVASLALAALLLAGCRSPANNVRLAAKVASVAALDQMDASETKAITLRNIGILVRDAAAGEPIDLAQLRLVVLDNLRAAYVGNDEVIVLLLLEEVVSAIVAEFADSPGVPSEEVQVLVHAAGVGVVEGVDFYVVVRFGDDEPPG